MTKEDVQELIKELEDDVEDLKSLNKDRIHNEKDLYEKTNNLGQRVSTIEGKLST
jgi:DNA repair exonuclease SbcCD ATPase subunit